MVEPLLTRHEESLMVLAAPAGPDARDSISASLVSRVLRSLKQNFDYVIVDTSPASTSTLQALDETDECIMIATLDVPTLKNVKIASETLDLLNFPDRGGHLVLNRADDKVGLTQQGRADPLDLNVPIPTSTEVANATNAGTPIVLAVPTTPPAAPSAAGSFRVERPRRLPPVRDRRACRRRRPSPRTPTPPQEVTT